MFIPENFAIKCFVMSSCPCEACTRFWLFIFEKNLVYAFSRERAQIVFVEVIIIETIEILQ